MSRPSADPRLQHVGQPQQQVHHGLVIFDAMGGGADEFLAAVVRRAVEDEIAGVDRRVDDLARRVLRAHHVADAFVERDRSARVMAFHHRHPDRRVRPALAEEAHALALGRGAVARHPPLRVGAIPFCRVGMRRMQHQADMADHAVEVAVVEQVGQAQEDADHLLIFGDAERGWRDPPLAAVARIADEAEIALGLRRGDDAARGAGRAEARGDAVLQAGRRAVVIAAHHHEPDQRAVVAVAKEGDALVAQMADAPLRVGEIPIAPVAIVLGRPIGGQGAARRAGREAAMGPARHGGLQGVAVPGAGLLIV